MDQSIELKQTCFICSGTTVSESIVKQIADRECHCSCLKCHECGTEFDSENTCYVEGDNVYCKPDYLRLFCKQCARCGQLFDFEERAYRVNNLYYHGNCFTCEACQEDIEPNSPFILSHSSLFCSEEHFNLYEAVEVKEEYHSPRTSTSSSSSPFSPPTPSVAKPAPGPKSQKSSPPVRAQEKHTRVRTVLNEQQLSVLRRFYSANPRPDAVMKDQLVELTGLTPRVIRVWFQNKRCKDKKKVLMDQTGGGQGSQCCDANPITPTVSQSSQQEEEGVGGTHEKTSSPELQPVSSDSFIGLASKENQPFSPWSESVDCFPPSSVITPGADKHSPMPLC